MDELLKKCQFSFLIVVADGKHYVLSAKLALIQEKEGFLWIFFSMSEFWIQTEHFK